MNELDKRIEKARQKMVAVGLDKGFTHKETVRLSQHLDKLINKKQKGEG